MRSAARGGGVDSDHHDIQGEAGARPAHAHFRAPAELIKARIGIYHKVAFLIKVNSRLILPLQPSGPDPRPGAHGRSYVG